MHWIIQNNIFNEKRYDDIITTLENGNVPYTTVKVIPFSHDLEPVPEVSNPIAVIGSYTLVKIAKKYGWGPGVFTNENFDYTVWSQHYDVLNGDALVVPFKDVNIVEPSFIRPCEDTKDFVATVMLPDDFHKWQDLVLNCNGATLTPETMVMVSTPKTIYEEYRFFVVDGKLITWSQYKSGRMVKYAEYVPEDAIAFAQKMVDVWQPDRGFVIDIALVPKDDLHFEHKVIEINCLNASGFYHCNVSKIIQSIDAME